MADAISIQIDQSALNEIRTIIQDINRDSNTAISRAINKAARQTQTLAVRKIYEQIAKKSSDIKALTKIAPFANANSLFAKLEVSGEPKGIEFYGAKVLLNGSVSFKIWRSGTTEKYRHAFLRKRDVGSPNPIFFMRDRNASSYDGRFPMRRKYGPSMASVFINTSGIENEVRENAGAVMLAELSRQINDVLKISQAI